MGWDKEKVAQLQLPDPADADPHQMCIRDSIEGEPGDIIVVGDLVFEIIDPEEMEERASQPVPYASTTRWTNVSLSGTEMSKKFEVTSSYPYEKVWISNQGKGDIQFTITRGSDTGTLVSWSDVTIKAGTSTSVYSTNSVSYTHLDVYKRQALLSPRRK